MESPADYFKAVVEPAYADFQLDPTSRHRAICAATIVHHFYERLFWYFNDHDQARLYGCTQDTDYLVYLTTYHCPDLALLRDSSDAVKHQFSNKPVSKILVATATDVTNLVGPDFVIGQTNRTVSDLLATVMAFWRRMLDTGAP